jgi:hypothetical protein
LKELSPISFRLKDTVEVGTVMGKNNWLELPTAGAVFEFTTVTVAVAALPISAAGTVAVNFVLLTNVVRRGVMLTPVCQSTVAPEANPAPETDSVKPEPPTWVDTGERSSMKGAAFCAHALEAMVASKGKHAAMAISRLWFLNLLSPSVLICG